MTVKTTMPRDAAGSFVQVLRLLAGGAHAVAIGAGSLRNVTAFDANTRVVEIYATVDCRIRQGDGTVTAVGTDSFLPAKTGRLYSLGGDQQTQATHIAVIQDPTAATAGTLDISEME